MAKSQRPVGMDKLSSSELHTKKNHVREVAHHFPSLRVLAFGQVWILMPTIF